MTGKGNISGLEVNCIAVEELIRFHTGYELDEDDCRDVVALCEHFNLEIPPEIETVRSCLHRQNR